MSRIMIKNVILNAEKIRPIQLSSRCVAKIRAGWADTRGQGNNEARSMGADCVITKNCSESDALVISEMFYHNFRMRSCCSYRDGTLSLVCGEAGSDAETLVSEVKGFITGYFSAKK